MLRAKADEGATLSVIRRGLTGTGSKCMVSKLVEIRVEAGATKRVAHVEPWKRCQDQSADEGTGNGN